MLLNYSAHIFAALLMLLHLIQCTAIYRNSTNMPDPNNLLFFFPLMETLDGQRGTAPDFKKPLANSTSYSIHIDAAGPYEAPAYSVTQSNQPLVEYDNVNKNLNSFTVAFWYKGATCQNTSGQGGGLLKYDEGFFVDCLDTKVLLKDKTGAVVSSTSITGGNMSNTWGFYAIAYSNTDKSVLHVRRFLDSALISDQPVTILTQSLAVNTITDSPSLHVGYRLSTTDLITCASLHKAALNLTEIGNLFRVCEDFSIQVLEDAKTTSTSGSPATTTTSTTTTTTTATTTSFFKTSATTKPPKPGLTTTIRSSSYYTDSAALIRAQGIQALIPSKGLVQRSRPEENAKRVIEKCDHFDPIRLTPPPIDPATPLTIEIAFEVNELADISNVEQTIAAYGSLLQRWSIVTCPSDCSTVFSDHPLEQVYVTSPSEIWLPHLRFKTSAQANIYMIDTPVGDDFLVTMNSKDADLFDNRTFNFYWTREGPFVSKCNLQLEQFPFDQQTCHFEFALLRATNLVIFDEHPLFVWQDAACESTAWKVIETSQTTSSEYFGGFNVSTVKFSVTLKRAPNYYVMNLFLPSGLLGVLGLGTFLICPDQPDRSMFTVTILLALMVALSDVNQHVPLNVQHNILSSYVQAMVWFSSVICIYELVTLWLSCSMYAKEKREAPRFCGAKLGLIRCLDIVAFAMAFGAFSSISYLFFVSYLL